MSTPVPHDRDLSGSTAPTTARNLTDEQKQRFGGMKFGATFFGWLTAIGCTLILVALLTALGAGISATTDTGATTADPAAIGIGGAIVVLVVLFLAYFIGGYVAGRMARFSGVKQGLGVWLWAIIAAVVVAVLSLVAGAQFDVLSQVPALPQLPVSADALTTGGIVAALAVLVVTLGGAILGGGTGMRYHRKVDRSTDEVLAARQPAR